MSAKVYEIVTDKIISELEKGNIPWKKPWRDDGTLPMNAISKKAYRGANLILLPREYHSPYFVSFKQCQNLGGMVKKGEKSHLVTFWKFFDVLKDGAKSENDVEKRIPMLRYYNVFNTDQTTIPTENLPELPPLVHHDPIPEAEKIISGMQNKPRIQEGECRAYYSNSKDLVNMPKKGLFSDIHSWYSTLFHEIGHSTGHVSRCSRKEVCSTDANHKFGSKDYSREELVAEMTSAFICGFCGINND